MNVFNRIVVVLLLLLSIPLLFFLIGTVIFPVPAADILSFLVGGLRNLDNVSLAARLPIILISLLLLAIDIVVLWFELRQAPTTRTVRLTQVSGGEAEVATDSIESRLSYHIDQVADVVRVTPTVTSTRKKDEDGIEIFLDVETSPDVVVPTKTEEIIGITRRILEEQMGLHLARVRVNIRHAPFPGPPAVPAPTVAQEEPAEPPEEEDLIEPAQVAQAPAALFQPETMAPAGATEAPEGSAQELEAFEPEPVTEDVVSEDLAQTPEEPWFKNNGEEEPEDTT